MDNFARTVRAWQRSAPDLMPDHADSYEPVRRPFDPTRLDLALPDWDSRLWIVRRRRPTVHGSFLGSFGHTNSTAHISLPLKTGSARNLSSLVDLILGLSAEWSPDLAIVHALCDREVEEARAVRRPDVMTTNRVTGAVAMSVGFSRELEHGLTSLYWLNVFGSRYEGLLGTKTLLAAPWHSIERTPYGLVAKVTRDPPSDENWGDFRAARDIIITTLGRDAFWPSGRRVPELGIRSQ